MLAADLGPQFNTALQCPITETIIPTSHLGDVVMTANEDLALDPNVVLGALFGDDGTLRKGPRLGSKVYSVPGHDFAFREQWITGNKEELLAAIRHDAKEVNLLRMLGLSIARHVSFVVPSRSGDIDETSERKPVIVTVAEMLSGLDATYTFDPRSNAAKAARILQVFQTYYTHEPVRPHKTDIAVAGQYSRQGVLMDLDLHTTKSPGSEPDPWHEQLDRMYKSFGLQSQQIEELANNYSYSSKDAQPNPV